jgi:hypothetical protein
MLRGSTLRTSSPSTSPATPTGGPGLPWNWWTFTAEAGRMALREPQIFLRSNGEILEDSALTAGGEKCLVPTFGQKLHLLRVDAVDVVTNLGGRMIPCSCRNSTT